jgi:hypothetical protein
MVILAILFAGVIHEGGHYLAALRFGERLKFRFSWGWLWKIPVPRFIWKMPSIECWKQIHIALAGFVMEFAAIPAFFLGVSSFWRWYAAAVLLHFVLYPFYAGGDSDWKWL